MEQVAIDASRCAVIPDEIDFASASVFSFVYGTVWHALVERGDIKAADKVLVLGAGGDIGQASCEVAKAFGASFSYSKKKEALEVQHHRQNRHSGRRQNRQCV